MIWVYPLWHKHDGIILKANQVLIDEEVVQAYPDNDGGRWYYDPETGRKVRLNE